MEAGTVPEKATISHRGEKYEIGRGRRFYGIWAIGAPYEAPIDRWPEHHDGWRQAWARFTMIEVPGTITAVGRERKSPLAALRRRRSLAGGSLAGGPVAGDSVVGGSVVGGPVVEGSVVDGTAAGEDAG